MEQLGYFNENKKYVQKHVIPCYATDHAFTLKPAAFMDYAQEIAYQAATQLGFGYDALQTHHTVWVLSRLEFKFLNPPKWRDIVELHTWHKGTDGLFFIRDFRMFLPDGSVAVTGTSSWLVINEETRRIVRSEEVLEMIPSSTICADNAIDHPAPKVAMPRGTEPEFVKEHTVSYSDVDFIGHMNNVRYAVIAMDAIGNDITFNRRVKQLDINFNKEARKGEVISLYRHFEDTGDGLCCIVEGKVDGRSSFCTSILFE